MRTHGNVLASWTEFDSTRWHRRRKVAGWLNAAAGLLFALGMVAVTLMTAGQDLDLGVVIFVDGLALLHLLGGVGFALNRRWSRKVLGPVSFIDLLAFPWGAVLGSYNLWVLYHTWPGTTAPRRRVVVVSTIGALLLVLAGAASRYATPPRSELDRQLSAAIELQGGTREFQQWLRAARKDTTSATTAARLVLRGLVRLPAEDQYTRLRLAVDGVDRTSTHDCAAFARGAATPAQRQAMLAGLDSTGRRQFVEVAARAVLAEIRDSPPPTVASDSDIAEYFDFVYQPLSDPDRRRFQAARDSPSTVSDQDICWFARWFNGRALVADSSRARWLRVVTTLGSRSGQ